MVRRVWVPLLFPFLVGVVRRDDDWNGERLLLLGFLVGVRSLVTRTFFFCGECGGDCCCDCGGS